MTLFSSGAMKSTLPPGLRVDAVLFHERENVGELVPDRPSYPRVRNSSP
jgi:hypothetical protein